MLYKLKGVVVLDMHNDYIWQSLSTVHRLASGESGYCLLGPLLLFLFKRMP